MLLYADHRQASVEVACYSLEGRREVVVASGEMIVHLVSPYIFTVMLSCVHLLAHGTSLYGAYEYT